ncbi:MAG: Flp family type IVb pilin [Acidobacteria bacterium]|nr:Flp family type IVb pilin [Acidobacteriota bacterium]
MLSLFARLRMLRRDDRGQDLIEYALLAGIIALGSVLVMGNVRDAINGVWNDIVNSLNNV